MRAVSRRRFLQASGAMVGTGLASSWLAGCDLSTEPSNKGDGSNSNGDKGPEAPSLAEQVKAGDLPPVEERLPKSPMVLEPLNEMGQYGGELNYVVNFATQGVPVNTTIGYENLVRWKRGMESDFTTDQVVVNVAENFEANDDGTEFTFKLREGMKWSDGEPFTADDIMFWYEDVVLNKTLSPIFPDWLNTGGEVPMVVEKVDDFTVVFKFTATNGLFLENLATQRGGGPTAHPAHFLKQFHEKYGTGLEKKAKDADLKNWSELFLNKLDLTATPESPTLNAWTMTAPVGGKTTRVVAERNPYYWKTDPDGSQLPYIDSVVFSLVNEDQAGVLKITSGEVDLVPTYFTKLQNKPVFADGREKGDYKFFETIPQQMNQMVVMVNLTHKNKVLREIFSNKDFRIGLSYALNRQELIDTVWQRQGEPWQAAPRPESPYYNEELAKQHTEYDVTKANEYLDKVLPDKNGDGIRLRPDGKALFFQVEVASIQPDNVDALDLVRQQWREVGIDIRVKNEAQELFFERMLANSHDACVWVGGGGLGPTMDPFYYMPYNFNTRYAMPWSFWYLNPNDPKAEEPPAQTRKQIDLYRQLLTTPDQDGRVDLMNQIIDIAVDEFYCMGVAMRDREYGVVSNKLGNVPDTAVSGWLHADLAPEDAQQFFFTE